MVHEKALAFAELVQVLHIRQAVLILSTCLSAGVPPLRLSSRMLLLLVLTLAKATGTRIPRLVVIRVLMLDGAGVVPPEVLPRRMPTATAVDVVPLRPLPMAHAMGKDLARLDVRHCMAPFDMNMSFPNAPPLHRRLPRRSIAALLEQAMRLSMLTEMTLLACIRAATPLVPGMEPEAASVGGRSMTMLADAFVVPVMSHPTRMGLAGIRCVATQMCPPSMMLAPTLSVVLVAMSAMDSILFTGLMLPDSGLMTVAPLVLSSVMLPVVTGPVELLAIVRILTWVRLAEGTDFRATAQGMQQALGPDVSKANDTLAVPTAADVLDGALMVASRVGLVEALRMHRPSVTAAWALGAARPMVGLTIVVSAPVGPIEKHITLALARRLLEMAILTLVCLEDTDFVPNMSRLLVCAEMAIRLAPRGAVDMRASGLLLGLEKSFSVPAAQAVFRLMLTLGGALARRGVPLLLFISARSMLVPEARLCLLETLQSNDMDFLDVVEVLSRRHCLLHMGEMSTPVLLGVSIEATCSME